MNVEKGLIMNRETIVPVILCGGSGTRLWPASRENHPKQFLPLMNDFSLLQNTMRRALRVSGADASNLVVVTLAAMKDGVEKQLSEMNEFATKHILCEPSARNTAAAVAFAAAYVYRTFGPDAIMWVLPADHHITREDVLSTAFGHALSAAKDDHLVTFGISPSRPDTGYGYIKLGAAKNENVRMADRFVEKPDAKTAQSYLDAGDYLWNSGMFLFSVASVLAHFEEYANDIMTSTFAAMENGTQTNPDAKTYAAVQSIPFDKAIMEKSKKVAVVPCDPEWSDVGSWESLWDIRAKDKNNNVIEGKAACHNATGCLIQGKDRLIAVAGLHDIVVVETDDALLITHKSDGDSMKSLVKGLKDSGAIETIDHPAAPQATQPWSLVKSLGEKSLNAREISIPAGQQKIFHGQESGLCLYTVLEGSATIMVGGTVKTLESFQSADIQATGDYTIANHTAKPLKMIEVQKTAQEGIYFGSETKPAGVKKVA
jgi:mannose-1-phosphate guanylyltransferase/mannose-6-phosphate isomerase